MAELHLLLTFFLTLFFALFETTRLFLSVFCLFSKDNTNPCGCVRWFSSIFLELSGCYLDTTTATTATNQTVSICFLSFLKRQHQPLWLCPMVFFDISLNCLVTIFILLCSFFQIRTQVAGEGQLSDGVGPILRTHQPHLSPFPLDPKVLSYLLGCPSYLVWFFGLVLTYLLWCDVVLVLVLS